jgi:outer membrane lipoprotein LolB
VSLPVKLAYAVIFFATFFMAGCAAPIKTTNSNSPEIPPWHGRLAVRVEADLPQSPSQSFSAGFELSGNPLAGELTLYTPLGTTAATLTWTPQTATLRANGDIRYFESLAALIKQAVGTEIPVAALFAWLAGDNMVAAGWSADLSQQTNGKITARRMEPAPQAELRLMLEK